MTETAVPDHRGSFRWQGTAAVSAVFVLSGFAALVYQVAWQRALAAIYGSNAESVAVVVTAFMLGLGLGSLLGGRLADRPRIDHLAVFAVFEVLVCAYGFGSLPMLDYVGSLTGPVGAGSVFLATFLALLLPTLVMGATLPLLVCHAVRQNRSVGYSLALLYFANTVGGAVAAVGTAIVLLRHFGLAATVWVAAAANAVVVLLAIVLRLTSGSRAPAPSTPDGSVGLEPAATVGAAGRSRVWWMSGCAMAVGFLSLSWEILWLRVYAFASGGTISVFGLFLGIYLLGIAVGSLLARHFCNVGKPGSAGDGQEVRGVVRTAGWAVAIAGPVAYLHTPIAAFLAEYGLVMTGMAIAGAAGGLYGLVLPLVAEAGIPPDGRAGRRLSYVYLANIAGSALGSGLTGLILFDLAGMAAISVGLLAASTVLAGSMLMFGAGGVEARWRLLGAVAAVAACLFAISRPLYGSMYERLLWKKPSDHYEPFAHVAETRSGVVAVTADGTVYGTGAYDGRLNVSLDEDRNYIYRAYAVGALHPAPRRVLMLGLGSGSWAQVLAHLPRVEEVTIVEINAGYLDILQRYPLVRGVLANPKVSIVVDDGRRWLNANADARFDAIVANVTLHWRQNATHLLSREFFALAASRLEPGGILYFNATGSREAMRTACTSFAGGLRFANFMAVGDEPVRFDVDRLRDTVRRTRVEGGSPARDADAWLADRLEPLTHPDHLEPCDAILERTVGVRLVTDDNLAPEASAPWFWYYRP